MDPATGELGGHGRDIGGRRMHDHAHLRLPGLDMDQWMDMQELGRHRCDLVGGHHPGAQPEQENQPGAGGGETQPPLRDRLDPPGCGEHHIDGLRVFEDVIWTVRRLRAVVGTGRRIGREARLDMRAQLVGVIGQAQQVKCCHRSRVQARVTDGQPI